MQEIHEAINVITAYREKVLRQGSSTVDDRRRLNRTIAALCRASGEVDPSRALTPTTLGGDKTPEGFASLADAYVNAALAVIEGQTLAVEPDRPARGRPNSHRHPVTGRYMSAEQVQLLEELRVISVA